MLIRNHPTILIQIFYKFNFIFSKIFIYLINDNPVKEISTHEQVQTKQREWVWMNWPSCINLWMIESLNLKKKTFLFQKSQ